MKMKILNPSKDVHSGHKNAPCVSRAHANRGNRVVIGVIIIIMAVIIISIINFIEGLLGTANFLPVTQGPGKRGYVPLLPG